MRYRHRYRAWNQDCFVPSMYWYLDPIGIARWQNDDTEADIILMQYTGLKDKNGVEIYEGDVVEGKKAPMGEFASNVKGVVIFSGMAFAFKGKSESGNKWFYTITREGWKQDNAVEIIGNIYENPELVEDNDH